MSVPSELLIVAWISSICCFLVLLTSLFSSLRSKVFMQIIACISFSLMCGNIPYLTVLRTGNDSFWCAFTGFLNLYFYPASWIWTCILVAFQYKLVSSGNSPYSRLLIHSIGWGIPLVTTLLILSTNTYGRFSSNDDADVCTIGGPFRTAFLWHIISYYGLFVVCLIFMLTLYLRVLRKRTRGSIALSPQMLKLVLESLHLYPICMAICWIPEMIAFIIQYIRDDDAFYEVALIIKLCNGLITTLIFFGKSQHARHLWLQLFLGRANLLQKPQYSVDSTTMSENSDILAGDYADGGADPFVKVDRPLMLRAESFQSSTDDRWSVVVR